MRSCGILASVQNSNITLTAHTTKGLLALGTGEQRLWEQIREKNFNTKGCELRLATVSPGDGLGTSTFPARGRAKLRGEGGLHDLDTVVT